MMDQTSSSTESLSWVSTSDEKWMILLTGKVMLQDSEMKRLCRPLCLRTESKEWWYKPFSIEHMLSYAH